MHPARRRPAARCAAAALALCSLGAHAQSVRYVDAGRGQVPVYLPSTYDDSTPMPLIVMLHGYSTSGSQQEAYFRFLAHQEAYGFMLAIPQGEDDLLGNPFWNATDACCDFFDSGVDDSAYLLAVIDAVKAICAVEERRVCLVGHSNGGFMAYRMACDHADVIASIASLAGATHDDPDDCAPSTTVHTLEIHGTDDNVIFYEGGYIGSSHYPGAVETAELWAANNGCAVVADHSSPPLDLDRGIPGAETLIATYEQDCAPGGSAELWTIVGGGHTPSLSASFSPAVIEWLLDHPKPCPADFNGDGAANTLDVLAYLNAWSARDPAADCNADGIIDTRDVLCFLGLWTTGC
ncbi:MAG TPA: GC-type dockerin domain-anchored protein [Phycisphaerales bacterium]|nr:GC-type dockerin domain-anchored protein [Phycisphaerales bacterium]